MPEIDAFEKAIAHAEIAEALRMAAELERSAQVLKGSIARLEYTIGGGKNEASTISVATALTQIAQIAESVDAATRDRLLSQVTIIRTVFKTEP